MNLQYLANKIKDEQEKAVNRGLVPCGKYAVSLRRAYVELFSVPVEIVKRPTYKGGYGLRNILYCSRDDLELYLYYRANTFSASEAISMLKTLKILKF